MKSSEFNKISVNQQNFLLKSLLEKLPHVVLLFDVTEQRSTFINNSIFDLLGYTIEEIHDLKDNLLEVIFHPEDYKKVDQYNQDFRDLKLGDSVKHINRWRHKNGEYFVFQSTVMPFRFNEQGECVEVMGIAENITDFLNSKEHLLSCMSGLQDVIQDIAHKLRHDHSNVLGVLQLAESAQSDHLNLEQLKVLSDGLLSSAKKMDENIIDTVDNIYLVKNKLDELLQMLNH